MNTLQVKKLLPTIITLLIVVELGGAVTEGVSQGNWGRFGFDLVLAGILYLTWDRLKAVVQEKKAEYRAKMEGSTDSLRLWDAMAFSLLWSDEIYNDVPADRRRLIVISYTLIVAGILAIYLNIGSGLMPLVLAGVLVLAAVNLLSWALSLERGEKESLQTELKLAHDVQSSLMPKETPNIPGFDIAGMSLPAREVGGDHFDYLPHDNGQFCIAVFDVSGKGMQAAMAAVFTSGAYSAEVKRCSSVGEVLTRLNASVHAHSRRGQFVSVLVAMLDTHRKTLTFANAGQSKPVLRSNGSVRVLDAEGVPFPLGMKADTVYDQKMVELHPGDTVFLMTDGVTEAMNLAKEQYGQERLERRIAQMDAPSMSAERMLSHVVHDVRVYAGAAAQHDDMTMVVIKVL